MEVSGQLHTSVAVCLEKEPLVCILFEVGWASRASVGALKREKFTHFYQELNHES
jgi:hypothetical protein